MDIIARTIPHDQQRYPERRNGRFMKLPAEVRFWRLVNLDDPEKCWLWRGGTDGRYGYGYFYRGVNPKRHIQAHRFSFEFFNGRLAVPYTLHTCDVAACVNPHHLYEGTQHDNMRDRRLRNRTARGERSGTVRLTAAQVDEARLLRGVESAESIAKRFGVCRATIGHIWTRRNWK